uniref:Anoctamin n=1 Tax=Oryzias latipes TaxID=8090 RepID=A0A3B3HKM0_ORYLA
MNFQTFCKSKSRSDRENTFTIMMFTFQFFTLFSSLFYIAFFLGRINGYPGNYLQIAGQRLEECHPSGCLTNLFIQMIVIMTLSQFFSNIAELTRPTDDKHQYCWKERCDDCLGEYWEKNYELTDTNDYNLFYETLKMVIQFSFTTLFVAAFPLAPLMALINNVGAIRLAAIRMVRLQRLLVPKKTNSIGVWTNVLEAIGVLAVITNGLVIGVTSEFIPRLVYRYGYGPCAMGVPNTHCMSGYINNMNYCGGHCTNSICDGIIYAWHVFVCFLQFFSESLVFLQFLMFLLPDVPIAWHCHIHHNGFPLFFIHHYNVWLIRHYHPISLDLEVPQDLCPLILYHLLRCFPF